MKLKKLVALTTATIVSASLLVGCSGDDSSSDDKLTVAMITDVAGVKAINPEMEIQVQYANSFTDQAKGKAIATQMYSKGADVIFTSGGDVGIGAIEAAKERGKFAIGVDRDQSSLAPDNVLTSAIKRVEVGVFETVKELVDGNFKGGETAVYGLEEGAVGIPDTTKNLVSQDIIDFVNEEAKKFESGELQAPKNYEEYKQMVK